MQPYHDFLSDQNYCFRGDITHTTVRRLIGHESKSAKNSP